jgi:drug/metabolite transporter (DMT)-like permease
MRAGGALVIVGGLIVIGGEAVLTIGTHGIVGDLMFAAAGLMFATFGTLLRLWRIPATTAAAVISVVSLVVVPVHGMLAGFDRMAALGWWENIQQAVLQGVLAGPGALYLFVQAVILLGAARASVFTALVPPFILLVGWVVLGEAPTALQIAGLVIVLTGFRMAQRG